MDTNWAFNGADHCVATSLAPPLVPVVIDWYYLGKVVPMLTVDLVARLHQLETRPKSFNVSRPLCRVGQAPNNNIRVFLHEVLQKVPRRYIWNPNDIAITSIKVMVTQLDIPPQVVSSEGAPSLP